MGMITDRYVNILLNNKMYTAFKALCGGQSSQKNFWGLSIIIPELLKVETGSECDGCRINAEIGRDVLN